MMSTLRGDGRLGMLRDELPHAVGRVLRGRFGYVETRVVRRGSDALFAAPHLYLRIELAPEPSGGCVMRASVRARSIVAGFASQLTVNGGWRLLYLTHLGPDARVDELDAKLAEVRARLKSDPETERRLAA